MTKKKLNPRQNSDDGVQTFSINFTSKIFKKYEAIKKGHFKLTINHDFIKINIKNQKEYALQEN